MAKGAPRAVSRLRLIIASRYSAVSIVAYKKSSLCCVSECPVPPFVLHRANESLSQYSNAIQKEQFDFRRVVDTFFAWSAVRSEGRKVATTAQSST